MANVDNLNFKVILDDTEFNTKVKRDIKLAQDLNTRLSNLLQIKARLTSLSAQDAASAKRQSDVLAKQAIDQERIKKAAAQTALEEEKVRTQAAKTAVEMQKITQAAANAALAQQRVSTEAQRTAAATNQAALNAQRFRTETQRTATETQRTATATQNTANATARAELAQRRLRDYSSQTTTQVQSQSRLMNELKGYVLGYLSIHGATQLLSSLVRVTGEFELQKTTLAAMLGDLNKAEQVITRIQGLAVESPFQFKELTTYAKQLSAFSVPAEELFETTKMLADISAGLGVGMDRIVLAYGQVRSAAFLRGQEVRQFTEAGIPILDELAKQFSELEGRAVSTGEVFDKISARLVPFEMVAKVMKDLTSEGGKFYNMQEVQAETLRGKISNLKDAYEVMLNEIGEGQSEKIKGVVDWTRKLMQNYEETGRTLKGLIITYGLYKTAVIAAELATKTFNATNHQLVGSLITLGKYLATNPYVALAAAVAAVGFAAYKSATALDSYEKVQQSVVQSQEKFNKAINNENAKLDALFAKLRLAKEGTEEYNTAKSQIYSKYSGYISALKAEGIEVENLGVLYLNLKNKIQEAYKTKFLSTATEDIEKTYGEGIDKLYKRFSQVTKAMSNELGRELMAVEKESLWQYILGDDSALNKSEVAGIRGLATSDNLWAMGWNFGGIIKTARAEAKMLAEAYTQGLADIESAYRVTKKELEEPPQLATGWRKTVQDTLKGLGLNKGTSFGLWAEDTTQSTSYVEDMIKRYKELGEEIKWVSSFDTDQAERLKKNKNAIEAIAKALKIDIKNLAANDSGTWESKEERRIKRLIETLRKLQDHYEKLKALGVSDDSIKTLFEGMFPELVQQQGQEFVTGLNYIDQAKTLIEELRKLNPEAADKVLITLNADAASDYEKNLNTAIQATKKYYESMRKLASEDFNLEGEGISLDISRVASELSSKTNEIELNARKLKETLMSIDLRDEKVLSGLKDAFNKEFGEGSWDKFYAEYLSKGEQAINDFSAKMKQYEKKLAQEQINDLASKYVGEKIEGLNLSDWGDKSLAQIEYIRQRLIALMKEDIKLPKSVVESLTRLGLSTDVLIAKIKELFGERLQDATIEKFKELADMIGEVTAQASELGSQLIELGDTTDSEFLRSFGKSLQFVNELTDMLTDCNSLMEAFAKNSEDAGEDIKEIAEGLSDAADNGKKAGEDMENLAKSSDWVTMIIKLVVSLLGKVVNGINESQQALHEARMAAIEYANALKQIEFDALTKASQTIFGTNEYGKFKTSMQEMQKYQNNILETQKLIGVSKEELTKTYASGSYFFSDTEALAKLFGRQMDDIIVDQRSRWQKFWGTGKDALKVVNMSEFMGEDGFLDGDKLREFYNAYADDISNSNREAIESILGDWDLYVQAMDNVTSYVTDLMGNVADGIADAFITSFKESGEAALDYADIMDEVATNIAKSVVKSMIIDQIASDKKTKQISNLLFAGDASGAMAVVDEAMQSAQELTPVIQKFLKGMEPYFKMEEDSASLGDGIKGITEDTANLLASYLNAIRADVSYARTIWERMDATTQRIASILAEFSAPSLMEYQAQIAANTYNTMIATQSILSKLDAVVTYSDGPAGVRVYS